MSKWREIKYYAHGTPTKTTKRLRRSHFFEARIMGALSSCGIYVFNSQLGGGDMIVTKCKNCLKVLRARKRKP